MRVVAPLDGATLKTSAEIAQETGIAQPTVRRHLTESVKNGVVETVGKGRWTKYRRSAKAK